MKYNEQIPHHLVLPNMGDLWDLAPEDIDWLIEEISTKSELDVGLFALEGFLYCWNKAGRSKDPLSRIKLAIYDKAELKQRLETFLNPPQRVELENEKKWRQKLDARNRIEEEQFQNLRMQIKNELNNNG